MMMFRTSKSKTTSWRSVFGYVKKLFSLQDATLEHSNLEVIWKRTTFCYIWLRLGKKMADRAKIRIRPVRIFGKSDDRKFRISAHRRESNEICRIIWSFAASNQSIQVTSSKQPVPSTHRVILLSSPDQVV